MEPFSPQALIKQYRRLSEEDKIVFLQLLGQGATADAPVRVAAELPPTERLQFASWIHDNCIADFLPRLVREARLLAREKPEASDEEFERALDEAFRQGMVSINESLTELAATELKQIRERGSDPANVKTYIEICDKRRAGNSTVGQLASDYGRSRQRISQIVKDEPKWRRLAQRLSSD
jgi:hypothetical protein